MLYRTRSLGDQLTSESSPKYPVSGREETFVPSKGATAAKLAGTYGTYVPCGDNCSCLEVRTSVKRDLIYREKRPTIIGALPCCSCAGQVSKET